MTAFFELSEVSPLQIWEGVVAWAVAGEHATLAAIELAPGAVVPEHHHPNEQTGILVRGSLRFRVGDEAKDLTPGAMWVIPGGTPHDVTVGPEGAFLVELFAPPRSDWAGLPQLDPQLPALF
jgi:quercetin dioxygenase-like cupin family protein